MIGRYERRALTARGDVRGAKVVSDWKLEPPRQCLAVADLNEFGVDAVLAASLAVMSPVPRPVEAAPA